jgi:hypothetical protein
MKNRFNNIADKLKQLLNVKNDKELAAILGLEYKNYSNKKVRGVIPLKEIIKLCQERSISLDWVFFDQGGSTYHPIMAEINKKLSNTDFVETVTIALHLDKKLLAELVYYAQKLDSMNLTEHPEYDDLIDRSMESREFMKYMEDFLNKTSRLKDLIDKRKSDNSNKDIEENN